jgi:HPt (histidine-containing phosphotransfer) domain-containing protein
MSILKDEAQGNRPVIDLELGAKILNASPETAKQMIGQLVNLLPDDLKKLQAAYSENNYGALQYLAHYIKGGASYCGTPRLKSAASQLEEFIHRGLSGKEINTVYDNLCKEISAVIHEYQKIAVKKYKNNLEGGGDI